MKPEEKHVIARMLEAATVTLGAVTIVILASVAGAKAYLAFQPSSLEAQAVQTDLAQAPAAATSTPGSN